MKHYAMILNDVVIGVVQGEEFPHFPPTTSGELVEAVGCSKLARIGDLVVDGEIIETGIPIPETPSEQELLQAEMLLNQCNILINQENQDAVLAEILINQLGV